MIICGLQKSSIVTILTDAISSCAVYTEIKYYLFCRFLASSYPDEKVNCWLLSRFHICIMYSCVSGLSSLKEFLYVLLNVLFGMKISNRYSFNDVNCGSCT